MRKSIGLLVVAAVMLSSSWIVAQVPPGNPRNGKEVYERHCLRCHGAKLDGNGEDGQYLVVPPADLRSMEVRLKSDWELLIAISHGVLFSPMHGWRNRLTDQEIMDVLSYIRMVAPPRAVS